VAVSVVKRDSLQWKLSRVHSTTQRQLLTRSNCCAQYVCFTVWWYWILFVPFLSYVHSMHYQYYSKQVLGWKDSFIENCSKSRRTSPHWKTKLMRCVLTVLLYWCYCIVSFYAVGMIWTIRVESAIKYLPAFYLHEKLKPMCNSV